MKITRVQVRFRAPDHRRETTDEALELFQKM
jgi:hypothetical protein